MKATIMRVWPDSLPEGADTIEVVVREDLARSLSTVYAEVPVRGTYSPHIGFSHNNAQVITFPLMVCSSLVVGDTRTTKNVMNDVLFLETLIYSKYYEGQTSGIKSYHTPPPATWVMVRGPNLDPSVPKAYRLWKGVVTDLTMTDRGPVDAVTGYPYHVAVDLTLRVTEPRLGGVLPVAKSGTVKGSLGN